MAPSCAKSSASYGHIPQHFAARVNVFCQDYLNPYINFHRPCYFPTTSTDAKGKVRKHYRLADMTTPYAKLRALPGAAQCLKPGITFAQLDTIVSMITLRDGNSRLFDQGT